MFQPSMTTTAMDNNLLGREIQVIQLFVAACRHHEHDCTAHFLHIGALAWRFVVFRLQDGIKRKDAVKYLQGRLAAAGLAKVNVSAVMKSHWLHELCPAVAEVKVSVLKALLPLCNAKDEIPQFKEGISLDGVSRLVARILAERVNADTVRSEVAALLGAGAKVERKAWEKLAMYLNHADRHCLHETLRNDRQLRQRIAAVLASVQAQESAAAAEPAVNVA